MFKGGEIQSQTDALMSLNLDTELERNVLNTSNVDKVWSFFSFLHSSRSSLSNGLLDIQVRSLLATE